MILMGEAKKVTREMIQKIDDRRNTLFDMAEKSENEVARAILHLSTEVCELEKLVALAIFLWKG